MTFFQCAYTNRKNTAYKKEAYIQKIVKTFLYSCKLVKGNRRKQQESEEKRKGTKKCKGLLFVLLILSCFSEGAAVFFAPPSSDLLRCKCDGCRLNPYKDSPTF